MQGALIDVLEGVLHVSVIEIIQDSFVDYEQPVALAAISFHFLLGHPRIFPSHYDTIGAASAEDDIQFLETCFVETEDFEVVRNIVDIRQIVLGRTGSGKSALFEHIKNKENDRVISIDPQELALTYVSNSSVIRYFSDLGVNLDPFYKLLWRHVLTVEVLRKHLEAHANRREGKFWDALIEMFSKPTQKDKSARQAVGYLRKWGEKFWEETEYRVKEIMSTMENELSAQTGFDVNTQSFKLGGSSEGKSSLTNEEKIEVVTRGQRVVSETQVQDLSKVRNLLDGVLSDRQKYYYILIDRLDENWVEEKLRYRLIMALLDSVKEMSRVSNIKVLVAIRRDLIDRVFRMVREAGFQEEKYQSLYLPLHWSSDKIMEILDKRINELVTSRYQKRQRVTHRDLLPKRINKIPITKFITDRAERPRDVISFFNKCIESAEGRPKLTASTLKRAEGEYSRQRLRALGDEWHADYPGPARFRRHSKKPSFFI